MVACCFSACLVTCCVVGFVVVCGRLLVCLCLVLVLLLACCLCCWRFVLFVTSIVVYDVVVLCFVAGGLFVFRGFVIVVVGFVCCLLV